MGMETLVKQETKKKHSWKDDICKICGCARIKETHPHNEKWTYYNYVDTETGEIRRSIECKTKQLIMIL